MVHLNISNHFTSGKFKGGNADERKFGRLGRALCRRDVALHEIKTLSGSNFSSDNFVHTIAKNDDLISHVFRVFALFL